MSRLAGVSLGALSMFPVEMVLECPISPWVGRVALVNLGVLASQSQLVLTHLPYFLLRDYPALLMGLRATLQILFSFPFFNDMEFPFLIPVGV